MQNEGHVRSEGLELAESGEGREDAPSAGDPAFTTNFRVRKCIQVSDGTGAEAWRSCR